MPVLSIVIRVEYDTDAEARRAAQMVDEELTVAFRGKNVETNIHIDDDAAQHEHLKDAHE